MPPPTQMVLRDGYSEFHYGQPDPDLLPVEEMRRAAGTALDTFGPDLLAYGAPEGAWPLLAWIQERVRDREGVAVALHECIGTAGNSDAIDQFCTLFTRPGDVAIVESPTYHLGLRILRDHHLDLRAVPVDADGLRLDVLDATLARLNREGKPARVLYTIPTFHNPTGVNLAMGRRHELVDMAVRHGFLILEDDVYRELVYDGASPASLFSLAPRGTVLRMGSFAKSLAPGLRLGWLDCSADQARRFADGGLRDSGGAPSFTAAMMVAALCRSGDFDAHVSRLRAAYRERRDALATALARHLPDGCTFSTPGGGYFIWVTLPAGLDAEAVLRAADAHRVAFVPGGRVCLDGRGRDCLRLAFSLMKPAQLEEGARRLGAAIAAAA
ncbi:MAG: PLP-dependent aminotransferase family protein [Acidobacteria bacterium]|nr:PLP-dependent aminotransferase family protein [Acidobacteriota bacterium]